MSSRAGRVMFKFLQPCRDREKSLSRPRTNSKRPVPVTHSQSRSSSLFRPEFLPVFINASSVIPVAIRRTGHEVNQQRLQCRLRLHRQEPRWGWPFGEPQFWRYILALFFFTPFKFWPLHPLHCFPQPWRVGVVTTDRRIQPTLLRICLQWLVCGRYERSVKRKSDDKEVISECE